MRIRLHWMATGACLSTLLPTAIGYAWCPATTDLDGRPSPGDCCVKSGEPLVWRQRQTSYEIHMNGSKDLSPDQVREAAEIAFSQWENIQCDGEGTGVRAQLLESSSDEDIPNIDGGYLEKNTIVFADDWLSRGVGHGSEVYALTTVWHNTKTGRIYGADMEINQQTYFVMSCPDTGCECGSSSTFDQCVVQEDGRKGPVDILNVLTHEAGHYFGLAHSCEPAATMWPSAECCESFRFSLEQDDMEGFCSFYGPKDDGCGCTVPGQLSASKRSLAASMGALAILSWIRRKKKKHEDRTT